MSVKCTSRVWEQSKATGSSRLTLLAIADFANEDGVGWPGQDRLADMVQISVSSIKRLLPDLVESGELWRGRRREGGPNAYIVLVGLDQASLKRAIDLVVDLGCDRQGVEKDLLKKAPGTTYSTTLVLPTVPPGTTAMIPDPLLPIIDPSSSPATPDDELSFPVKEDRWLNAGEVGVQDNSGRKWKTTRQQLFSDDTPEWEEVEESEYVDLDEDGFPTAPRSPIVKFIEGRGRKLTPNQQQKLAEGVPKHNPRYPSPAHLFTHDPLFESYVEAKVAWANGAIDGKKKNPGSLVSSICNYETEKFGWFDFKQSREEKVGETTHTPAPDYQPDIPEYDDDLGEWAAAKAGSMPLKKEMVWSKDLEASDGI